MNYYGDNEYFSNKVVSQSRLAKTCTVAAQIL
jgi:hypothetical protein